MRVFCPGERYTPAIEAELRENLRARTAPDMTVGLVCVDAVPPGAANGKFRAVVERDRRHRD
jgi:hypothetical protein